MLLRITTVIHYPILSEWVYLLLWVFCVGGKFMIPEAFKKEGLGKGVALLAGFLIAAILTKAQGG
jgi:hypothetical protein